ncbi:MAG: AAA family ATPase [Gemmatimonadota bacterium]
MRDQAAALRELRALRPVEPRIPQGPPAVVLGSGKGGVGKSVLAIMLAASIARLGHRVLLVDGAQNLGNLHVLLGARPAADLDAVLSGDRAPEDLVQPVAPGLWLLAADSGADTLYALGAVDRARLHHRLSSVYDGYDAVVIDGGSGLESVVRVATMRATSLAVVAVPEPTALTDAYALIKIMSLQLPGLPVAVIANRTADDAEGARLHEMLATASQRFLGRDLAYLGAIPEDPSMRDAVRTPSRLLLHDNSGPAAAAVQRLALACIPLGPRTPGLESES